MNSADYDYRIIVSDLLAWYEANKRELPWRSNPQPYYVWVSEIMLQQTRVEAVKEYFKRFMTELPNVESLAAVSEDRLLKLWEGLGYYNRARNLKKAAEDIVQLHAGKIPGDYVQLMTLPGIGSYTAGAIASIAYGEAVPAVDGNVLRVAMRLAGSYEDITKAGLKKQLEEQLLHVIPKHSPGAFNQALMELGAMICIPNGRPLCEKCPVRQYCVASQKKIEQELPVKPAKKARRQEEKTILVLKYKDRYAIRQRPEKGLLAKLWEYPNFQQKMNIEQMEMWLEQQEIESYNMMLLGEAVHIFSHVEWHMIGYEIDIKEMGDWEKSSLYKEYIWATPDELEQVYSLPAAFDAYKSSCRK